VNRSLHLNWLVMNKLRNLTRRLAATASAIPFLAVFLAVCDPAAGISHDAGIVYPAGASPYALVLLTRGFQERDAAEALAARISRLIYDFHMGRQ
jgi:hypothetical protein